MKIIIIGCGKVGSALAEELTMENHEVAIVDISAQKLQEVGEDLDALQIQGNGSSINVLMDAGVTSADRMPSEDWMIIDDGRCRCQRKMGSE